MLSGVFAVLDPAAKASVCEQTLDAAMAEAAKRQMRWVARTKMLETLGAMTDGELQVLRAVVDGQLNKRIARQLEISERTVEARRKRIFEKTETTSVALLVRMIVESIGVEGLYKKCDERVGSPPKPHLNMSANSITSSQAASRRIP